MNWLQHVEKWKDCQRCPLANQRFRICLARGSIPAEVVFIGEAPGMSEDTHGEPFIGPAGHLLDQIVERSLPAGVPWIMTNLVGCFPREAKSHGDNEPERGEILECRPRLVELVNIAKPRLIVRVGKLVVTYAAFDLSVPYVDIDHPAYILRMPFAQRGFATQRCIVRIANAYADVVQSTFQFTSWGLEDAGTTERHRLRKMYEEHARRTGRSHPDNDIAF